jgi:hypothetical protein
VSTEFHEIIELLKQGEAKKAWHLLGIHLHDDKPDDGGVHTNSGGNSPPPPVPPHN